MTDPQNETPLTEGTFWRWFEPMDPDQPRPLVTNDDTGEEI